MAVTEAEIMMTDAVVVMEEAVTTIEGTEESEDTAMTIVAMLPVELIVIVAMIDMDVEEMSDEVVAITIVTTEVATVMAADLVKPPLLLLMVTQLLAERAGSHMPEVEETLMTDTTVDIDR